MWQVDRLNIEQIRNNDPPFPKRYSFPTSDALFVYVANASICIEEVFFFLWNVSIMMSNFLEIDFMIKTNDKRQTVGFHPFISVYKAYCCLLLHVFSLLNFSTILTRILHVLRLFSNHGIFKTIFNCDKHIYANYLYILTRT